jgi:hypothetical protein
MPPRPANYIPRPDGDFDAWLRQYLTGAVPWWDKHGGDGELDALRDLALVWQGAYAAHIAAQAQAGGAAAAKNAARGGCEEEIRRLTRIVQGAPDTTDAQRAAMGITVPSQGGTGFQPVTSRPIVQVDTSQRLMHSLRFSDEATPTRRARPGGVLGAEVWLRLVAGGTGDWGSGTGGAGGGGGASPVPSAQSQVPGFAFLALATRTPHTVEFRAADGGKTAVYMLRWLGARGGVGPWSEVAGATVAA